MRSVVTLGRLLLAGLAASSLALAGCSGIGRALGTAKVSPDEFSIVTKAPLVLPPDYALKPPAIGQKSDDADASAAAQRALVGDSDIFTADMSPGERALLSAAGAQYADPLIRQVVDQEYASLIDEKPSLTDRLVFWDHKSPAAGATTPINANAESKRIEKTQQTVSAQSSPAPSSESESNAPQEAQGTAVPDEVQGQAPPTIGETHHSHLLDGIF